MWLRKSTTSQNDRNENLINSSSIDFTFVLEFCFVVFIFVVVENEREIERILKYHQDEYYLFRSVFHKKGNLKTFDGKKNTRRKHFQFIYV